MRYRLVLLLALLAVVLPARGHAADAAPEPEPEPEPALEPDVLPAPPEPPPSAASPERAPTREPPVPELRKHWYGLQTLVVDGISLALVAGSGLETAGPYFATAGVLGYSLGAPIVHFAHQRPVAALASFALRVPAPLIVGGLTGAASCAVQSGDFCGLAGLAPAMTLAVTAIVVDAILLSREVVPIPPKPAYASAPLRIVPTLAVTPRQALLGVAVTM